MIIFDSSCEKGNEFLEVNFSRLIDRVQNNDRALVDLDIRGKISDSEFMSLFRSLKSNTAVKSLILRGYQYTCDLSNKQIYSGLASLLKNNASITSLSLLHTGMTDDAVMCITDALKSNDSLNYLKITNADKFVSSINLPGELALIKMLVRIGDSRYFKLDYSEMSFKGYAVILSCKGPVQISGLRNYNPLELYSEISAEKNIIEQSTINSKKHIIDRIAFELGQQDFAEDFIENFNNFMHDTFISKAEIFNNTVERLKEKFYNDLSKYSAVTSIGLAGADTISSLSEIYKEDLDNAMKGYKQSQLDAADFLRSLGMSLDKLALDQERAFLENKHLIESGAIEIERNNCTVAECSSIENGIRIQSDSEENTSLNNTTQLEHLIEKVLQIKEKARSSDVSIGHFALDNHSEEVFIESKIVPKKLEIDNNLSGKEYFAAWYNKVIESDYDTVIFSIGSAYHKDQQIPNLSMGSGKIAILNIDKCFVEEEMRIVSDYDNVSVNYLNCGIEVVDRCLFGTQKQIQALKENCIMQKELAIALEEIIISGKKVVLLSHISHGAPRYFFEEVLKDEQIIKSYGDKFLFIHSYFEDLPTIVCSKKFINEIMSDDLGNYVVPDDYALNQKWAKESLKDNAVVDRIASIYDYGINIFHNTQELTSLDLPEGRIYRNLSAITFDNIMELLTSGEVSGFDNDSAYF